jgi:threonine synthase
VVRELMRKVDLEGGFDISHCPYWARLPAFGFVSGASSHQDRMRVIREVWAKYKIEIDPHTADGLRVAEQHREPGVPMVCLETALPAKFEASIVEALGHKPARPKGFEGIESKPQRVEVMNIDVAAVKARIVAVAGGHGE